MKKIILLVIFASFLTGCSATYNLEIYNNKVKEDMEYYDLNSDNWDTSSYREAVEYSVDYPYPAFNSSEVHEDDSTKADGVEYYKSSFINEPDKLGQKLSYHKFNLSNFSDSFMVRRCYEFFNVLEEDDRIVISTSAKNTCFDQYPMLDDITIKLKTNHKVVSSNASTVSGYHYTWNISRENKDNANISIILKKNEYVFNYENEFVKKILTYGGIIVILVVVGSRVYLHFKNKNQMMNEI